MKQRVAGRDLGNQASSVDRAHMKRPLVPSLLAVMRLIRSLVDPTLAVFIVRSSLQFLVSYLNSPFLLLLAGGALARERKGSGDIGFSN